MSIVTFKKKSVIRHGSKRSAKPPGGYWLPQGPFGNPGSTSSVMLLAGMSYPGPVGFSLEGAHRSISVGRDMKMSKQGTPFRGIYPVGYGGTHGRYAKSDPVLNTGEASLIIKGNQWEFIKPSVLSTRGMLSKKYKWAYNGKYPQAWVQPNYTGNQTDSSSQGLYIQTKAAANDCHVDVNKNDQYVGHIVKCGSMGCQTTPAHGYTMGMQQANAPYTKYIDVPQDASQHTLHVQRKCSNPIGVQKPFPYAVQGGTGILRGGTSVSHVASSCNVTNTFMTPPDWYLATKPNANSV